VYLELRFPVVCEHDGHGCDADATYEETDGGHEPPAVPAATHTRLNILVCQQHMDMDDILLL